MWINYSSRLVMYAAAWAQTSREARAARDSLQQAHAVKDATAWVSHDLPGVATLPPGEPEDTTRSRTAFAAGGASMLALMAVVRRIVNRKDRS